MCGSILWEKCLKVGSEGVRERDGKDREDVQRHHFNRSLSSTSRLKSFFSNVRNNDFSRFFSNVRNNDFSRFLSIFVITSSVVIFNPLQLFPGCSIPNNDYSTFCTINPNPLPILEARSRIRNIHNRRNSILSGNDRPVGELTSHFRNQPPSAG